MTAAVESFLDAAHTKLTEGTLAASFPGFAAALDAASSALSAEQRQEFRDACHAHPLSGLLLEDPFTRRSVEKPRGYSGDAAMLDFIYEGLPPDLVASTSLAGRRVFEFTAGHSASARAVRYRRDLLATRVDATANRVAFPRVLSVACGHLREAKFSRAATARLLGEWVAMDQDATSLEVVSSGLAPYGVVPLKASVGDLLKGSFRPEGFDFVYSAGLYDYLDNVVAARLTSILFDALRPGGELLVANFVPRFPGHAYMDLFMDWRLICRDEDAVRALTDNLPRSDVARLATFADPTGCVAYLQTTKASPVSGRSAVSESMPRPYARVA